jgi:hypothetical protein
MMSRTNANNRPVQRRWDALFRDSELSGLNAQITKCVDLWSGKGTASAEEEWQKKLSFFRGVSGCSRTQLAAHPMRIGRLASSVIQAKVRRGFVSGSEPNQVVNPTPGWNRECESLGQTGGRERTGRRSPLQNGELSRRGQSP